MKYRIMIIEDDISIAELLSSHIEKYGYESMIVDNFENVMLNYHEFQPHLVLIDINLPKYDGYVWCKEIRKISTCPIIFITAREGKMDQIMALENGADDYITKPFFYEIVIAKIKSHIRRCYGIYVTPIQERKIELNGLILYPERLEITFNKNKIILTKKEAILAEVFMKKYPNVVSREILLNKLWDDINFVEENTLNVNVTRLRKRLIELSIENAIEPVRGIGYRLNITWRNE
ncbi:response regulator transcription factor [Tepidibacter hydrothermalis]|uniref:Stage 0 sporulation protein A homolog n=1 Tax=Tepidibacter hydrothermalis TaxID=3036126 RepID=A0ABY8ECR2_9FIRM|nr:response regulator transcription factor [Tepidibacter hydrothermalis]WFD08655.1 response regulator transcription factor [Tepidibacter hydrothermalis]